MSAAAPQRPVVDVALAIAPGTEREIAASLAACLEAPPLDGSLESIVDWLDALFDWLRAPGAIELPRTAPVSGRSQAARVWLLVGVLDALPELRAEVRAAFGRLLRASSALSLFTDTGRAISGGFWAEATRRLTRPLLPEAPDAGHLSYVVSRLFDDKEAADWLDEIPLGLVSELARALAGEGREAWSAARAELIDILDVLTTRVAAVGLAEDVRVRGSGYAVPDAPFMRAAELGLWTSAQLRAVDSGEEPESPPEEARRVLLDALAACDHEIDAVVEHLEEFGVSVDLVYRLEQLRVAIDRTRSALDVLLPAPNTPPAAPALRLFSSLLREQLRDHSLRALVRTSIRQLARKVIERNGETGEHYITSSRAEWLLMLRSAAGGGAFTALTTVIKFLTAKLALPGLFLIGLLNSLNYAASFVLLHFLHFTLATKQPSMTAARLASMLGEAKARRDYVELAEETARTARSQLAAVVGNLGAVIPVCVAIDLSLRALHGAAFLSVEKAQATLDSLHPLASGTIPFAALTGALLWASSVIAGSIDNWAVYRRLPEAIAGHKRLRRWIGADRTAALAAGFSRNVAGVSGSIVLGFMLGMTSVVGSFFGLPLDVRHVTLSTGSVAFAVMSLGPAASEAAAWAAAGIAIVGLLNFGVSYTLALLVALRARGVPSGDSVRVGLIVARRFLRSPRPFFFPPPS